MKLGVRAHDYGRHQAAKLAGILKDEGFEAAQLAVPKAIVGVENYRSMTEKDAEEIGAAFRENQIEISVLGCYIDLSSRDKAVREEHLQQFEHALLWGSELNAGMVGTESSYGIVTMEDKKKTWDTVLDGVLRIVEQAEKCGVNVGIEPVAAHTLYSVEWTRKLLDRVGSRRLKVIFDPVNLLTAERIDRQEELWEECFRTLGGDIAVVHLKDFVVAEDHTFAPCLLGEGMMRYETLFAWLHREKSDISILREEIVPETAHRDLAFMKGLLKREEE